VLGIHYMSVVQHRLENMRWQITRENFWWRKYDDLDDYGCDDDAGGGSDNCDEDVSEGDSSENNLYVGIVLDMDWKFS